MVTWNFPDGNITDLLKRRDIRASQDGHHKLQTHSSLIQRLSLEREIEGHQGCVNALSWNSKGSLLISGSDDTKINIWSYAKRKLVHSINTGHSANIFCTKFVPETSDELVVSGAGDAEVRLFNVSCFSGRRGDENAPEPSAAFHCHSRRVKKLAVEAGNPNVVWSASEDGTLRQHDFRECRSCPPAGSSRQECRNVLLDLRGGAKKSLADPPKQPLALKSCDISLTRPHQLLVGGSDAFARLYDRRMLPPLSTCQNKQNPPPCVEYFCPMHLSDRGRSSLHLTHVTFSPNGEEVLLSYSGEHVYLMNVAFGSETALKYHAGDFQKQMNIASLPNGIEIPPPNTPSNRFSKKNAFSSRVKCRELIKSAKFCLEEETNYLHGIEACSEVLSHNIDPSLMHEGLCVRAGLFLKRKWKNDVLIAIRDCIKAISIGNSSFMPYFYMSEAQLQLGKHKEALEYAILAKRFAPSNSEVIEKVERIKEHLAAEANKDASRDGPRSGEDSDYEEEMELDFETSISGDEEREIEGNILHASVNLRFHRRSDPAKEKSIKNEESNAQNECPEAAIDMQQRYVGHCNVGTDIKQASFLGQNGDFIASGSDDGRWFVWEKRTGRLIKMMYGDEAVVNCVQCHPFDCVVATSGIDNTVKVWTPCAQIPSLVSGGIAGPETADIFGALERNQKKLCRNRETDLHLAFLERSRMHELVEGSFHPFECAQS